MINWVRRISSSDSLFYKELSNIKQTLIINNFTNYSIDKQIKLPLKKFRKHNMSNHPDIKISKNINSFYHDQMLSNYK